MRAAGSVGTQPGDSAATALSLASGVLALLLLPGLVVTQWLTLQGIPIRFWFNATATVAFVVLIAIGWRSVPATFRWLGLATVLAVTASLAVNRVPVGTAIRGTVPYVVPILAVAAGTAARLTHRDRQKALMGHVVLAVVMAAAAALQLLIGEPAYRWLAQDLAYPRWWERGRATGLVVNPGRLAQVGLVITSIAPVGPAQWTAVLAGAFLVGASGGRIAIVAAAVLGATAVLFWRHEHRIWILRAAAAITVFFLTTLALSPEARADLLSRTDKTIEDVVDSDDIVEDVRVSSIGAAVSAWREAPLVGWGPGRFGSTTAWATNSELHARFGLEDLRSASVATALPESGDDREVDVGTAQLDVGLAQTLAETGALGLSVVLGLFGVLAWLSWRRRQPVAFALTGLLGVFSLVGPGVVDASLAVVVLWWAGTVISE